MALLERASEAGLQEDWEAAAESLTQASTVWEARQNFFHTILKHDELDEAESLFAGAEAAGGAAEDTTLPVLLINDGHVMDQNLHACGRDQAWLDKELRARRLTSPRQVFLLTLDEAGTVVCVTKEGAS